MVLVDRKIERTLDDLFGAFPLPDQNKIDPKIVVGNYRIQDMLGLFEKADRFFETCDPVFWTPEEPVRPGHVGVELAQHERCRAVADDLDTELEIFDRLLAVPFLVITERDLAIRFGHPKPV